MLSPGQPYFHDGIRLTMQKCSNRLFINGSISRHEISHKLLVIDWLEHSAGLSTFWICAELQNQPPTVISTSDWHEGLVVILPKGFDGVHLA